MHELKLENLCSQYFEDNQITSLADYVRKVEELYLILEKENKVNEENNVCKENNSEGDQAKELRNGSSPKCWCKLNSANLSFHKLKHTGFF